MAQDDAADWLVIGALALPHLLYAFIWFFPNRWMTLFKSKSVEVFETVAWMLKGKLSNAPTAAFLHPAH